jgi:hypothetical protein
MNLYPHFTLLLSDFSEIRAGESARNSVKPAIFVKIIAGKNIILIGVSEITFMHVSETV